MLTLGKGTIGTCSGVTRRDFLRVGSLGAFGLSLAEAGALGAPGAGGQPAVILLMLVGGPSQLETWDPKPGAPREVRGPFGSIATSVPGVRISEHLPRMAELMDRVTLVRSLHHDAAPIHETGQQLVQTGRLCRLGQEHPHVGSVLARAAGERRMIGLPPFMMLPGPIGNTGVGISHGQSAGPLGAACEPFHLEADPASGDYNPHAVLDRALRFLDGARELPADAASASARLLGRGTRTAFDLAVERDSVREAYGSNSFGQSCLLARRLVESGVRMVTVNMFETVFNRVTWDCHGSRPFSTLDDYARELLPTLDAALSALLLDLESRGLLESTLVVATGEFGRTPRLNAAGGRDHWPGVWSALLAGGGTRRGHVVGASDAHAAEPADRPVSPAELVATMYHSVGIDPAGVLEAAGVEKLAAGEAPRPIAEAFA